MDLSSLPNYIIISIGVFVVSVTTFTLYLIQRYFKRHRDEKIRATFIYDDRSTKTISRLGVVDRILYDNLNYDYDDNLTVKKKGVKYIYYVVGNKNPIDFKNPKSSVMSYNDYKTIIESKVLNELLLDEEAFLSKSEKIILIAIGIMGITLFITLIYLSKQPVNIPLGDTYKDFIKNAVLEAIKG